MSKNVILSAKNIEVKFKVRNRVLTAIRNVSLDFEEGKVVAIVGESGSGKSVFTKTFTGMIDMNGEVSNGEIIFEGKNLLDNKTEEDWLNIRGKKIATVFQDPMTSLNPVRTIGYQISEVLMKHQGMSKEEAKKEAISLMARVGIHNPEQRYDEYPFQYSGGMRQRIVIAIALACHPKILICDEPTTALDVTIQAQVLELIDNLRKETNAAVIMITHDLGVVAKLCDKVCIMYGGKLVEKGSDKDIFYDPKHPYTKGLLNCVAHPEDGEEKELEPIPGSPPDLLNPPKGCPFVDRCSKAMRICKEYMPEEKEFNKGHACKCWLNEEMAKKVWGDVNE